MYLSSFSRFSSYLLYSALIIIHIFIFIFFYSFVITSLCCFSAPPLTSATPWNLTPLHAHLSPFSISNPFFSIICPSIPLLEKVTFAVKRSSPPLYHAVKKCHDIMSLVDTALIFPLMSLPYLSFSFSSDSLSQSESVSLSHPVSPLSSSEGRVSIWLSVSCSLSCCPVASIALQCQYIAPLSHTNTLMDAHIHPDGPFQLTYQSGWLLCWNCQELSKHDYWELLLTWGDRYTL